VIDLLLKERGAGTRIWIAAGVTDMRRGFQGLAAQVQTALEQQPYSGHIFIFRGRRGDMVKLLYERRSKNRPQNAAGAVFCGGVKVVHRRILVS
jgi:hypothetical protein